MGLEDSVSTDESGIPVRAVGRTFYDLAFTGGCVDHHTVADGDTNVALEYQNVTGFYITAVVDALILSAVAPDGGGHITLLYTGIVEAPINKTGTVKLIGTLCTQYILAAQTGFCCRNEGRYTAGTGVYIIAATAAGGRTAAAGFTAAATAAACGFCCFLCGTGEQFIAGGSYAWFW